MLTIGGIELAALEPIEKGWSEDKKYRAVTVDGASVLLRVTSGRADGKESEYEAMKRLAALGVPMCVPLAFERRGDGVYFLQSWIDGADAEEAVPALPVGRQYTYGLDAGRILRRIHSLPAPDTAEDWATRFNRKLDRKISLYSACPLHYEGGEALLRYIGEHRGLLAGRPQTFQHGDYHIGNMMLERGRLVVVDFNRSDHGDPWEEFNRIVWCAQASPPFARGMVEGYFDGEPPMAFWRLLALYIAGNTLSSLPWAIPFGQGEIDTMMRQAREVLGWYGGMKNPVPSWYRAGAADEVPGDGGCGKRPCEPERAV